MRVGHQGPGSCRETSHSSISVDTGAGEAAGDAAALQGAYELLEMPQGWRAFLALSAPADLLIDISESEPLPYLEWSTEAPSVGTEVYTAGFPLGDPEFTMTRGIVAKASAFGDTPWASIDSTIEHDANIQPGNSGGPLVGVDGRVVAVNYASGNQTNQSQFFAIESTLAQDVVDQLRDGDFESLGVNGTAVLDEEAGIAGIWVASTAPGSPASNAGLLPGDILTTNARRVDPLSPAGLSAASMTPSQQTLLHDLINEYTSRMVDDIAAFLDRVKDVRRG